MARVKIFRPDGSPSPYFWSNKKELDQALKTVYKSTGDGIKRMRGVHYDPTRNKLQRD